VLGNTLHPVVKQCLSDGFIVSHQAFERGRAGRVGEDGSRRQDHGNGKQAFEYVLHRSFSM
jgi:hypothetical protein